MKKENILTYFYKKKPRFVIYIHIKQILLSIMIHTPPFLSPSSFVLAPLGIPLILARGRAMAKLRIGP